MSNINYMDRKEVVGFVPSLLFKLFLYLKDRFDPKIPISDEEKITFEICNKLITDADSELTISPQQGKRFIKNEKKDIFISIEKNVISLSNNVCAHSCYINDIDSYSELIEKFDKLLEIQRSELEKAIKDQIKHSLESILKSIT